MSITYTWKITGMKVKNTGELSKAVFQTYWAKVGTDENGHIGTFSGATPFDVDNLDPNNFIDFNSLTEETVLGWIIPLVVGEYEQHVNKEIARQIAEKTAAIEEAKLPWKQEDVTPSPPPPTVTPQ